MTELWSLSLLGGALRRTKAEAPDPWRREEGRYTGKGRVCLGQMMLPPWVLVFGVSVLGDAECPLTVTVTGSLSC